MNCCTICGAQYKGPIHNCGYATITKDRLRELEAAERTLSERGRPSDESDAS